MMHLCYNYATALRGSEDFLFHLLSKLCTFFNVRLIDGPAGIFPTSYAMTGNQTHVSSVSLLLRDLIPERFTDWATVAAVGSDD